MMAYQQGDLVVHQNFGVGTVIGLETKNQDGDPCLYYRVGFEKTTIWVPVNEKREDRVRPVTPKAELNQYRQLLKSEPEPLDRDFRTRQTILIKRMAAGTYAGVCQVVRDLNAYQMIKSLTQFEKNLLQNARLALVTEWSISSGLSLEQASVEINHYLCTRIA
jgi:RNA polymerase-interacting CarD/CdnL/TRCF family regulator